MVKTSPPKARGLGSIPGQGAMVPHALQPINKQKQYCKKNSIDFKNGPHLKKKILKKKKLGLWANKRKQ